MLSPNSYLDDQFDFGDISITILLHFFRHYYKVSQYFINLKIKQGTIQNQILRKLLCFKQSCPDCFALTLANSESR
jgi:hypothetical protein